MNSAQITKKKISEYQIEDIKEIFIEVLKKISSKIILLEIGNGFINIALAKSQKNRLYIKKVFRQSIPDEAFDKSIPSDPVSFGIFLKQILSENKINTNRIAICLPSDACYTRLIEIPEEIKEDESTDFLENPDSGIQIPISLENSDFEIHLTKLPKSQLKDKAYDKYFLTSLPKKNVDIILDALKNANLEISSIQMSHMCIANLLRPEIEKLSEKELIISVDLLDEFTQFVIFDRSGPLLIKRLASIRNYPSIDEMKEISSSKADKIGNTKSQKKSKNYYALSKLDVKVLLKEISESFQNFLDNNNLNKNGKIFLSGRNSQHKNLVELIGENLRMDVSLISPVNSFFIKEFSYNPDEVNQFSMSRLIGLGLTLIKDNNLEDESSNKGFIIQKYSFKEESKDQNQEPIKGNSENKIVTNLLDSLNELNQENLKIKEKIQPKTKVDEKKKELPPLPNLKIKEKIEPKTKVDEKKKELPPLPNLKTVKAKSSYEKTSKNKENLDKNVEPEVKKNKSFKMDKSFLKND